MSEMNFDALVEKHGDGLLENLDSGSSEAPAPAERAAPTPEPVETKEEEAPEAFDLDQSTMEALGLAGKEPAVDPEKGTEEGPAPDLGSFAETLGFDVGQLVLRDGKIQIKTKVDGESADKSLADLVKGYQLQESTTRKSMELAKARETWEAERSQQKAELEQNLQLAAGMLQNDRETLVERYKAIEWDRVRVEDPAQYAALVADYQREEAQLVGRQQTIQATMQQGQQEQAQKQREHLQQLRDRESKALLSSMGWSEKDAGTKVGEVSQYLVGKQGYTQQELSQVFDHRFVGLADKARQWDNLQVKMADLREKKVALTQKVPAGASSSQGARGNASSTRKAAIARLKESGSVEDAASVFRNIPGLLD